MKKIFYCLLFLIFSKLIAQTGAPDKINYQGVARDASGNPIANQTVGLQFKISTSANPNFYNETQPAVTTNSFGLFTTKIGILTPLPLLGWENLPAVLQVSININNTGFSSLGSQTLASVPYALYALSAGNALPAGVRDGQTLRWDSTAQVWKKSNNITNDDIRVGIGLFPNEIKSKMHVTTFNQNDSSAFAAIHFNATDKQAALKAFIVGSTSSSSINPYNTAIYGSQNGADNSGSGFSLGSLNYGTSNGTGVGASGIGNSKTTSGMAIGIYGTTDPNTLTTNRYAALFDKGAVLISDSLMLGTTTNTGVVGDVLSRTSNGRAVWKTPTSSFSPFTISANFVHLVPANANSKVVVGNTTPTLFGYGSKLTVYNPVGNNDTAFSVFQYSTAHTIYANSKNASTNSYAGFFDGGLVSKGKNSLPTTFGFLVKDIANNDLLSVRNDGFVGIGTISPTTKLSIAGTSSAIGYPYNSSPQTKISIYNSDVTGLNYSSLAFTTFNSSTLGAYSSAEIVSENIDHTSNSRGNLIFLTREPANLNERMRISWDGKIGINTTAPTATLDVNGTSKFGTNGTAFTSLIHGTTSVILTTGFTSPGISGPMNVSIPNINPGDRVSVVLLPNTNTITYGMCITTALVSVAGNLEITFGALKVGAVPGATNYTINYMIIKP